MTIRIPSELYERIKIAAQITWLQFRDIDAKLDHLKSQNDELRRLAVDTLEAVSARK